MNRRTAFTVAVQALGGIAGAAIVLPADRFRARTALRARRRSPGRRSGPTADFSPDTYRPVVITRCREHRRGGQDDRLHPPGQPAATAPTSTPSPASTSRSRPAALTSAARSASSQAAGNFICPCHGGVYGFQGERIGGPPVRPLDRFQTRVTNGQVEVGPRYSVTNSLDPVRARDPGEFTGGIWELHLPAAALGAAAAVGGRGCPRSRGQAR